jgi:hypothetical protein
MSGEITPNDAKKRELRSLKDCHQTSDSLRGQAARFAAKYLAVYRIKKANAQRIRFERLRMAF